MEQPRDGELAGRDALLGSDLLHALDEVEVALEVLALEARVGPAEVVLGEIVGRRDLAGEEAAPERAVGDEADAELADRREDLVLGVARPERVLGLKRADRVDLMRAPDRAGGCLGEAQVAHLALLDELLHRAHRLLDRRVRVHAVLVVEIDVVDAQAAERSVARLMHVLGIAAHAQPLAVRPPHVAELGGEHHLVAATSDGATHELLVRERAVHVGRVEEVHAQLERSLDRRDRLRLVALAVELGHAHAAESERGHRQSLIPKLALMHSVPLPATFATYPRP